MTTPMSNVAEERKRKAEETMVRLLTARDTQFPGLKFHEVLVNFKIKLEEKEPGIEVNRVVVEGYLDGLLSQGKIVKSGEFFQWNHHRGLCHTFADGICKCCGTEKLLNTSCPICQIINPI